MRKDGSWTKKGQRAIMTVLSEVSSKLTRGQLAVVIQTAPMSIQRVIPLIKHDLPYTAALLGGREVVS